jgi:hypothetical protein
MSTVLHLDLKRTTKTTAELRVFTSNPNVYESRSLNLSEVDVLVAVMERDYYVSAFWNAIAGLSGLAFVAGVCGRSGFRVGSIGSL